MLDVTFDKAIMVSILEPVEFVDLVGYLEYNHIRAQMLKNLEMKPDDFVCPKVGLATMKKSLNKTMLLIVSFLPEFRMLLLVARRRGSSSITSPHVLWTKLLLLLIVSTVLCTSYL
jgi:hypothetical protein